MKKTFKCNLFIKFLIISIMSALILTATFLTVSAESNVSGSPAPGGGVTTVNELIAALGGENNASVGSDGATVYLSKDIILSSPIVIQSGYYRIVGRGCAIYRAFSDGAMFHLVAGSLTDSKGEPISLPVLTLGAETKIEDQDLTEPDLVLDGNSEGFKEAVNGPIISILGKGEVTVNPSTKLTNNRSASPGGAIYLESFGQGSEVTPLEPTLYINGGEISGNSSEVAGGAIAAYGRLKSSPSGNIQINSCKIEGNTVSPIDASEIGKGGAIFSDGMRLVLNGCEINSNSADEGGALHVNHDTVISNCTLNKNLASRNGGAIYVDRLVNENAQPAAPASVSLISSYLTENRSNGTGGVIVNKGNLSFPSEASSYISNNTADGNGSVIYNEGTVDLDSGELFYNSTTGGRGGIYNLGTVNYNGADMRINTATVGGAVYNLGTFNYKKGCFSGNKCTVKNAPQIANLGKFSMSGSFVIDEDVIGLFPVTATDGSTSYALIDVSDKITTNVKMSIAIMKAIPEEGEVKELAYGAKDGMVIFNGLRMFTQTAAERSLIVENKLGGYELTPDGELQYVFPLMPLGAWIGCAAGVAVVAFGIVFIIKKRPFKKEDTEETEQE